VSMAAAAKVEVRSVYPEPGGLVRLSVTGGEAVLRVPTDAEYLRFAASARSVRSAGLQAVQVAFLDELTTRFGGLPTGRAPARWWRIYLGGCWRFATSR